MTWNWENGRKFNGDPLSNWLIETGGFEDGQFLQPFIFNFFPTKLAAATGKTLEDTVLRIARTLDDLKSDSQIFFNVHDVFHWAYTALEYSDHPSELILFSRSQSETPSEMKTGLVRDLLRSARLSGAIGVPTIGSFAPTFDGNEASKAADEAITMLKRQKEPKDGQPVVVSAVIDHAIPFLNERYSMDGYGTRIQALWRQGPMEGGDQGGFAIGSSWDKDSIDEARRCVETIPGLSEGDIFHLNRARRTDQLHFSGDVPLALSSTHGGLVLDLAAGEDPSTCVPNVRWEILAAELPAQVVRRSNGVRFDPYVKSALNWFFYKRHTDPALIDRPVSIVLTYAFGGYSDRRDGQNRMDADIQLRLERDEIAAACLPAGNGYLENIHAKLPVAQTLSEHPIEFVVPPDSASACFLQIWFDDACANQPVEFFIGPPGQQLTLPALNAGEFTDLKFNGSGPAVARAYWDTDEPLHALPCGMTQKARARLVLAIAPTRQSRAVRTEVPVGRWVINAKQKTGKAIRCLHTWLDARKKKGRQTPFLRMWVERTDAIAGFPIDRRQAYLEHKDHDPILENTRRDECLDPTGPIKRYATLNSSANADGAIVVGAIVGARQPTRMALYSAAGWDGLQRFPTLAASAEFSDARQNRLAAGTLTSTSRFLAGTSAASAIAARTAAVHLIRYHHLVGRPEAKDHLRAWLEALAQSNCISEPQERLGKGVLPSMHEGRMAVRGSPC